MQHLPKGEKKGAGWYCLPMPVDDDAAIIGGRERFGFPKKMADRITLDRDGPHVAGSVERNGVQLFVVEGEFVDPQPADVHAWGVSAGRPGTADPARRPGPSCSSPSPLSTEARSSTPPS